MHSPPLPPLPSPWLGRAGNVRSWHRHSLFCRHRNAAGTVSRKNSRALHSVAALSAMAFGSPSGMSLAFTVEVAITGAPPSFLLLLHLSIILLLSSTLISSSPPLHRLLPLLLSSCAHRAASSLCIAAHGAGAPRLHRWTAPPQHVSVP